LEAIAQALHQVQDGDPESAYLRSLIQPVERVLKMNRLVAEDLKAAHQGLCQIANCLGYPPKPVPEPEQLNPGKVKIKSPQIAQAMEALIGQLHPTGKLQQAQRSLFSALKKRWKLYAQDLLPCYDIPGLPQDNLQLEALFGRLRRHQRRISGRKSTQELHDFGLNKTTKIIRNNRSQTGLLPVFRSTISRTQGPHRPISQSKQINGYE
jgi:hypothetical protein